MPCSGRVSASGARCLAERMIRGKPNGWFGPGIPSVSPVVIPVVGREQDEKTHLFRPRNWRVSHEALGLPLNLYGIGPIS